MTIWTGCYSDSWKGVITPASFAHPAKFSKALVERILNYMTEQSWLKPGDWIGDPFGGVACGGIIATYLGYQWIGVELEEKFFCLAGDNFIKHEPYWASMNRARPIIILGDSRQFDVRVQAILTSPPYVSGGHHTDVFHGGNKEKRRGQGILEGYRAPGQIATLKSGEVDAVVTSSPFTGARSGRGIIVKGHNDPTRPSSKHIGARTFQGKDAERDPANAEVLPTGKIDAVISSPPYEAISAGAGGLNHLPARDSGWKPAPECGPDVWHKKGVGFCLTKDLPSGQQSGRKKGTSQSADQTYGKTPGQISHAKKAPIDAVLTSPPYEDSINSKSHGIDFSKAKKDYPGRVNHPERNASHAKAADNMRYGETPGQIGAANGETYWQAMAKVYHACFKSLKPGGVMAIVVKDFVQDKKRMPLCDDTMRLLVWLGFQEIERIHAMLTEELIEADLFEGTRIKRVDRKSFFRRLHESRLAPDDPRRIDFEEVLFVRKPA